MPCTQADVRRIAASLPGLVAARDHLAFGVKRGAREVGVAWAWRERLHPRKPRVPSSTVLAVRVRDLEEKESLLALAPEKYFTEPHYDGYPAVLVRLPRVTRTELRRLLDEACRAAAEPPRRPRRR